MRLGRHGIFKLSYFTIDCCAQKNKLNTSEVLLRGLYDIGTIIEIIVHIDSGVL